MPSAPTFHVVSGLAVRRIIDDHRWQIFGTVEMAYRLHASGNTLNPDSYFLRNPDKPSARIIALPAHLGWPTVWVGACGATFEHGRNPCSEAPRAHKIGSRAQSIISHRACVS